MHFMVFYSCKCLYIYIYIIFFNFVNYIHHIKLMSLIKRLYLVVTGPCSNVMVAVYALPLNKDTVKIKLIRIFKQKLI